MHLAQFPTGDTETVINLDSITHFQGYTGIDEKTVTEVYTTGTVDGCSPYPIVVAAPLAEVIAFIDATVGAVPSFSVWQAKNRVPA